MKYYLNYLILFFFIAVFVNKVPISIDDREVSLLYVCDLKGNFYFDEEGRKGLSTLAEVKRRETEKIMGKSGVSLLVTSGRVTDIATVGTNFGILNKVPFDAALIGEEELFYLEENPNLKKLKLPIIARRENKISIPMERLFSVDGVKVWVGGNLNTIDSEEIKEINTFFVFLDEGARFFQRTESEKRENIRMIDKIKGYDPKKYYFFIAPDLNGNSYSFNKNVYKLNCPLGKKGKIGQLKLYYRKGDLIRQKQKFIFLNTKIKDKSWINPKRETLEYLK